jgi:hypothetical protein
MEMKMMADNIDDYASDQRGSTTSSSEMIYEDQRDQ